MHKMAISLQELQQRVETYAADCGDSLVNSDEILFGPGFRMGFDAEVTPLFNKPQAVTGQLNEWAFRQINERLDGPPVKWIGNDEHCPDAIRVDLLNKLAAQREVMRLLVRSKGNHFRAVLSDEYTKFDNAEFLDMVAEAVNSAGTEVEVHRSQVEDEMRAYVLFPRITFTNPNPDPRGDGELHPAIYIRNSERGGGAARITGAVYRYVCGNGIIWGWNEQEQLAVRHRFITQGAMRIMVAEGIAVAMRMTEIAAKAFMASQEKHLHKPDLKSIVNNWASSYGISVSTGERWLDVVTAQATEYGRPQDPRLFDLVNAATLVAQDQNPLEREIMERMAGDLLAGTQRTVSES